MDCLLLKFLLILVIRTKLKSNHQHSQFYFDQVKLILIICIPSKHVFQLLNCQQHLNALSLKSYQFQPD